MNYYGDHDLYAADWLERLIEAGELPAGIVDRRGIEEVQGHELQGYRQVHLFAGIGGWAHALDLAGWPGAWPVWTGSCPCQPFSAAGQRKGTADERHLWPEMFRLVGDCRPPVVFGEQVGGPLGLAWLDGVFSDLESINYACGAADLPAGGVGAPHTRQRLFWVAIAPGGGFGQRRGEAGSEGGQGRAESREEPAHGGRTGGLADAGSGGIWDCRHTEDGTAASGSEGTDGQRERIRADVASGVPSLFDRLADAERDGGRGDQPGRGQDRRAADRRAGAGAAADGVGLDHAAGPRREGSRRGENREPHGQPAPGGLSADPGTVGRLGNTAGRGQRADGGAPGDGRHADQSDAAGGLADARGGGLRDGGRAEAGGAPGAGQGGDGQRQRVWPDAASGVHGLPADGVAQGDAGTPGLPLPQRGDVPGAGRGGEGGAVGEPGGSSGVAQGDTSAGGLAGYDMQQAAGNGEDPGHGLRSPWSDFALVYCRDDKFRRISAQPGDEPLAHGIPSRRADPRMGYLLARLGELGHRPDAARRLLKDARRNRVGRLRGYGNAIVPQVAAVFVRVVMDILKGWQP